MRNQNSFQQINKSCNMPYSSSSTITTTHTVSSKSNNQSEDEHISYHSTHSSNPSNANESNMIFDSMHSNANNASISMESNLESIEFMHQNSIASNNYSINNDFRNAIVNSTLIGCVGDNTTTTSIYHSNDTISSLTTGLNDDNGKISLAQKQLDRCGVTSLVHSRNFQTNTPNSNFTSPVSSNVIKSRQGSDLLDMSYMNSNTGSTVSSLANLNYNSPPRATSPTSIQVRELLDQIQRLKNSSNSIDEDHLHNNSKQVEFPEFASGSKSPPKRPTSLVNKGKLFSIKNKAVYLPISSRINNSNSFSKLKSPLSNAGISLLLGRGTRGRTGLTKSAPTTPGSLPTHFQDNSPLLNELDEDFVDADIEHG